ncbi:MAG: lantibiotic dehydratase, partial [Actinobacteria bacterium]|nr:lantibiotic dehydratase [Actinomycetota bacterium]
PGVRHTEFSSAALAPVAAELFQADGPGWSGARLHSPDLQLVADSLDALNRDDFTVVLSEMHVAWATNTSGGLVWGHPDPAALRTALRADLGAGRLRPLLPTSWPRHSNRLAFALESPDDAQLGFAPAPGADPDRLVPIGSMTVRAVNGVPVVFAADGRSWPLIEAFDRPLAEVVVEAFKLTGTGDHSPRLTVDRLVVARESWHTTLRGCPLAEGSRVGEVIEESELFLAARAWRRQLSLPEQVFAKIGSETKPVFVDFSSPLYVGSFGAMLRAARRAGGEDIPLSLSEMLPDTDHAWVPDALGRRYVSELRLQIRDPLTALTEIGAGR